MGNFFGRKDYDDENTGSSERDSTPFSDKLEQNVKKLIQDIKAPYQLALAEFRDEERNFNRQRMEFLKEKDSYMEKIKKLREHEGTQGNNELTEENETLKSENSRLKDEIKQLRKAMSASHESRKRNGDIRSGDITHEDVKRKYTEFHTCSKKNRQLLKSLNCNTPEDRCKLLSKLTNLAYIECRKFVMDQHTKQLQHLYEPPSVPQDTPELSTLEEWRDRRAAFGLLMSVSGINPTVMPDDIEQKIISTLKEDEFLSNMCSTDDATATELLKSATNLAWVMSTLVPPAIETVAPGKYQEEWHERVSTGDQQQTNPEHDHQLVYCRPILFFGAEGTVGKEGAVKCLPVTDETGLQSQTDCATTFHDRSSSPAIDDKSIEMSTMCSSTHPVAKVIVVKPVEPVDTTED